MTTNQKPKTMLGSEMVVKSMLDQGTDVVFGYPGGAVLPLYDAMFKQNSLRHILVRHEQAAVHAAEGYARSTGKVGAVIVTSGPGATNTVTGLTDALMDSIPLVCVTGQVPSHLIGSDAFQEADVTGITRSCTKHNYLVTDINDLARTMHEAFMVARTGRPGPVLVDIPKDIFNASGAYDIRGAEKRISYKPVTKAPAKAVEKAVNLLAKAKKPVFYVGGGVINSGDKAVKALREIVKLTDYPCTTTLMGLGAYPGNDKLFLGMPGMHGSLEANMAMSDCDVMINVGARFDDRVTGRLDGFSQKSKKIHIDVDPSSVNKTVDVDIPVIGDAGEILEAMLVLLKKRTVTDTAKAAHQKALKSWWNEIAAWRKRDSFGFEDSKKTIKPQRALRELYDQVKKKDFYITTDVGQHQMWAAQHILYHEPNRWMSSGGLGTMGYGLPAALGVQVANPKKPVICVTGEASFMMNIQELATLVQYRLPVKILIVNNQYMGMVRQWQEMFHGCRYSESYMDSLPDFVKLAEAYGMRGLRCKKPADLSKTIETMMEHEGPVLADIWVDREENVYPMIPAGAAHHELILSAAEESDEILDPNRV